MLLGELVKPYWKEYEKSSAADFVFHKRSSMIIVIINLFIVLVSKSCKIKYKKIK